MTTVLVTAQDASPPPEPLGLSLNAFVALCTSISRIAFLFPVSQGLAQQKFLWFRCKAPLSDIQDLHGASGGFFGSFMLLLKMTCRRRTWKRGQACRPEPPTRD